MPPKKPKTKQKLFTMVYILCKSHAAESYLDLGLFEAERASEALCHSSSAVPENLWYDSKQCFVREPLYANRGMPETGRVVNMQR